MSGRSAIRVKNFQAEYDFRICNLSVSIYCVGNGKMVLDMFNRQSREVIFHNVEIKDGTQLIQCDLEDGVYNFKIYEVFSSDDYSERYLLYETNFTYSNPYDPKDGEIIIKNIKYDGMEYALRYYYKIINIVKDEKDERISYGDMVGYDKFDILKSINEPYRVRITSLDDEVREVFLEFKDEEEDDFLYFLFHRDKRMLLKDEEKIEQIDYDKYFELMDDKSSYLTTNCK